MANAAIELAVHMSHPEPEHWKSLGRLIGYLKVKDTKGIITINPEVLKSVVCFIPIMPHRRRQEIVPEV